MDIIVFVISLIAHQSKQKESTFEFWAPMGWKEGAGRDVHVPRVWTPTEDKAWIIQKILNPNLIWEWTN